MNTFGCADARELAPELALGILGGEARAEVLAHVEHCPACQVQLAELAETADALVLLAPEAEPPVGFERRTLAAMTHAERRRHWRVAKIVAVTAAAAVILSIVAVRITDGTRAPSTPIASPAAETVAMVGSDGLRVGRVDVTGTPTAVSMVLTVDYALPDGDYKVVLNPTGSASRSLGTVQVVGGRGSWSGTTASAGAASLALIDGSGKTRCSAELPTA